jgi:hypothetical protein
VKDAVHFDIGCGLGILREPYNVFGLCVSELRFTCSRWERQSTISFAVAVS